MEYSLGQTTYQDTKQTSINLRGQKLFQASFLTNYAKKLAINPGVGGEEKENNKTGPLVSSLAEFKPELGNWKRWIQILNWTTLNFLTESVQKAMEDTPRCQNKKKRNLKEHY